MAPKDNPGASSLHAEELDSQYFGGSEVRFFRLSNSAGMQVELMTYGATVLKVSVPGSEGDRLQLNRGLAAPEDYLDNPAHLGGVCGRVANRIADAEFTLDAQTYSLSANIGNHHLHGGTEGFDKKHWHADMVVDLDQQVGVCFSYVSADGEEGYPGTLTVQVTYTLNEQSELAINYVAHVADKATVVNLTNHTYWNLGRDETVLNHEISLHADQVLAVDDYLIPTGVMSDVTDTAFDCRTPRRIGDRYAELAVDAVDTTRVGYDHCYVFTPNLAADNTALMLIAKVTDPGTRIQMEVLTDQPGVQFYMGVFLDGSAPMGGHQQYGGLCLECQQLPDAPNHAEFPSIRLAPQETYTQRSIYRFAYPARLLSAMA